MIGIDIEMPKKCNDCPCAYFTEGASSDYCQINMQDFDDECAGKTIYGIKNGIYKKPKWCPLVELKGETEMKVDEQFKCKDCDNYNLCKYYHNRRETSFICKEFQNQWGYIKELENIRTEILKEYPCASNPKDKIIGYDIHIALEFIDKHIAELKGENK